APEAVDDATEEAGAHGDAERAAGGAGGEAGADARHRAERHAAGGAAAQRDDLREHRVLGAVRAGGGRVAERDDVAQRAVETDDVEREANGCAHAPDPLGGCGQQGVGPRAGAARRGAHSAAPAGTTAWASDEASSARSARSN